MIRCRQNVREVPSEGYGVRRRNFEVGRRSLRRLRDCQTACRCRLGDGNSGRCALRHDEVVEEDNDERSERSGAKKEGEVVVVVGNGVLARSRLWLGRRRAVTPCHGFDGSGHTITRGCERYATWTSSCSVRSESVDSRLFALISMLHTYSCVLRCLPLLTPHSRKDVVAFASRL